LVPLVAASGTASSHSSGQWPVASGAASCQLLHASVHINNPTHLLLTASTGVTLLRLATGGHYRGRSLGVREVVGSNPILHKMPTHPPRTRARPPTDSTSSTRTARYARKPYAGRRRTHRISSVHVCTLCRTPCRTLSTRSLRAKPPFVTFTACYSVFFYYKNKLAQTNISIFTITPPSLSFQHHILRPGGKKWGISSFRIPTREAKR
jgi:hypothetical protein